MQPASAGLTPTPSLYPSMAAAYDRCPSQVERNGAYEDDFTPRDHLEVNDRRIRKIFQLPHSNALEHYWR